MAIQAQLYPENFGLPMCGLQDWMLINPISSFEPDQIGFASQEPPLTSHLQQPPQTFPPHRHKAALSCSSSSSSTCGTMALPQSLAAQLEMQRQEIDCILQLQNERLRCALHEQRRQQLAAVLKSLESKALCLMRQKEEVLAQATRKTMELEASLRKAEIESESWQRMAKENEAMVVDLSNTLEQVRERLVVVSNGAQDAESSICGSCNREEKVEEEEGDKKKMVCKWCKSRKSCVLFLPCRHLCSCKACEAFLGSCPVCNSVKEASMEVFWV